MRKKSTQTPITERAERERKRGERGEQMQSRDRERGERGGAGGAGAGFGSCWRGQVREKEKNVWLSLSHTHLISVKRKHKPLAKKSTTQGCIYKFQNKDGES